MSKKQAVVLIHGIGEQVPMDTLRGFVNCVWSEDPSIRPTTESSQVWSKPDKISGDYELRRLTTAFNNRGERTDFFEFYWAHLMTGTQFSQVSAWVKLLLFRSPWRVPGKLLGIWWALWILAVAAVLALLNQKLQIVPLPPRTLAIAGAVWLLIGGSLTKLLLNVAGDAARYLHVAPPNINTRRTIREAGMALLKTLHDSGDYRRIVVVGHSLGSIIGYDILTHLWPRYHDQHVTKTSPVHPHLDLNALESAINTSGGGNAPNCRPLQEAYRQELQREGNGWLVTDFITLGSPLAHAAVLLARNEVEFEEKKKEREFPTCPPVMETIAGVQKFSFLKDNHDRVPHHAAVFAPTRWVNIYFPCSLTFFGDVIGGPVAPAFGSGVLDISVKTPVWGGFFSHTHYWTIPPAAAKTSIVPTCILALRNALDL